MENAKEGPHSELDSACAARLGMCSKKPFLGGEGKRTTSQQPYDTSKPYSTSTGLFVVPRTVCITGMRGRIAW